jgi:hypothetical protein
VQRLGLVVEVHERVDRVVDAEVVGLDHQVVVTPLELSAAHLPSSGRRVFRRTSGVSTNRFEAVSGERTARFV